MLHTFGVKVPLSGTLVSVAGYVTGPAWGCKLPNSRAPHNVTQRYDAHATKT